MKIEITPKELNEMHLVHVTGGNGWAMVEDIDEEYCRVIGIAKGSLGSQAYLAWKPRLSVWHLENPVTKLNEPVRIDPVALEALKTLRLEIKRGTKRVVSTRIVDAEKLSKASMKPLALILLVLVAPYLPQLIP